MKKLISSLIAFSVFVPVFAFAQTASNASLQAQIQSMMQQLSQLQGQLNGNTNAGAATTAMPSVATSSSDIFTRNLNFSSQGADVFRLQQALITDGYLTAISVPTGYFGPATKNALAAYQQAKGIVPASGFFGPLTRATFSGVGATVTALTATNGAQGSATVQYQYSQSQNSSTPAAAPQPTANLEANGSAGPIMVPYGSPVTLTWSSSNADSCQISPAGFTGTSGVQTVPNLTATQTYSLTCTKGILSAVSSVTVNVAASSQTYQQPTQTSPAAASNGTVSQQNALKAAQQYLNYTAFSHDGLVAQLEHDQFSQADATYGADNSGADWNAEAIKAAQNYLNYTAFSQGGLVAQLEHDQFTQAQATYGVNNANANWDNEAAKAAQQYMSYSAFSRGSLIAQLEHDQFTQEQATYGANAVDL